MNEITERSPKTTFRLFKRVVLWTTLFLSLITIGIVVWLGSYAMGRNTDIKTDSVIIDIPPGTSVRGISAILGESGLIKDDIRFLIFTRILGVSGKLRAGEFAIATGKNPLEVIDLLVQAVPLQHSVTIPEGLKIEEIAEIFAGQGWCEANEYIKLSRDPSFIEELGLGEMPSLEGYLYPDTYYLTRSKHGPRKLIEMQVTRFHTIWGELTKDLTSAPDMADTVTLASIVEKETGAPSERPLIAGVFHNRLQKGMRLQSDPTVVYGVEGANGPITRSQLRATTPYNTYVIPALPIGPIANPGKDALHAVLNPAETKYLYFVSKNDGTHQFSTNLRDHNRAVQKYQRKK